jgi:hypothetical protein
MVCGLIEGLGFRVGLRVEVSRLRVEGLVFSVLGLEFRVES